MRRRSRLWGLGCSLVVLSAAFVLQCPFRVYPSMEPYDEVPLPPDYPERTEWVFGRLMYPQHPQARFARWSRRFGGSIDWREGYTSWTQDDPRAGRHFAEVLRRLTRVQARSAEQPITLDDGDDVYHWPWLLAGEMGDWKLTDAQVKKLREYLQRGGDRERRLDLSHRLRPDPALPGTRASGPCGARKSTATTARLRTGAASSTTKAGSWY
jgi:hypothetical protein